MLARLRIGITHTHTHTHTSFHTSRYVPLVDSDVKAMQFFCIKNAEIAAKLQITVRYWRKVTAYA
jgi:hypothetical protein